MKIFNLFRREEERERKKKRRNNELFNSDVAQIDALKYRNFSFTSSLSCLDLDKFA